MENRDLGRCQTGQDTLVFRGLWVSCGQGSLYVREVNSHRAAGGTRGEVDPGINHPSELSLESNTEGRTPGK